MKILCPMSPAVRGHIDELAQLGADEFFMGYISDFNLSSMVLSRRPGTKNNFENLAAVEKIVANVQSAGRQAHLAVNSVFYPPQFLDAILRDLDAAVDMGVHGFIMADFNLFLSFTKRHPHAFVSSSTCMHAMNSGAARFLSSLGFSRVILPRHLTVEEMRDIISSCPDMEFEVFAKNDECPNVDGLCSYFHGVLRNNQPDPDSDKDDTACKLIRTANAQITALLKMNYSACGVCDLIELSDLPNFSLKISGRNLAFDVLRPDLEFVSRARDLLRDKPGRQQYADACRKAHENIYSAPCEQQCYRHALRPCG